MPETARILQFPARPAPSVGALDALHAARAYLAAKDEQGAEDRRTALLKTPDVLLSACSLLREKVETAASEVLGESSALYQVIVSMSGPLGVFDERDYFLGETALIAGTASRVLGKRSEAELWFDRADSGFRHTVNPAPLLASVSYQRLALRCEVGQYREVIELAPMLASSFGKLAMPREQAKCVFLEGLALKQSGSHEAATARFEALAGMGTSDLDPGLVGLAFVNLADIHAVDGRSDRAAIACSQALPLLARANRPVALAHLKGVMGEAFRRQGKTAECIDAYRASISDYEALGMATWVAYLRVVLAQVLLEDGQARQAEWQILAALPTIDEAQMVPEGFAAVAILRESVRQRKMNPQALSELRQYLRAQN
jgi:tetratricopeptide (TPR) repeat protein